jgi:hypothetical protein
LLSATIVGHQVPPRVVDDFLVQAIGKLHNLILSGHWARILRRLKIHRNGPAVILGRLFEIGVTLRHSEKLCNLPKALNISFSNIANRFQSGEKWGRLASIAPQKLRLINLSIIFDGVLFLKRCQIRGDDGVLLIGVEQL